MEHIVKIMGRNKEEVQMFQEIEQDFFSGRSRGNVDSQNLVVHVIGADDKGTPLGTQRPRGKVGTAR